MSKLLLDVRHLQVEFHTYQGKVKAVRNVSFSLQEKKTLGIVGESGCGKSVTSLSIMNLITDPGYITGGEIIFKEKNLLTMSNKEIESIRGNQIAMIFQDPMTSLNPVYTIGHQLSEMIQIHNKTLRKKERMEKVLHLLSMVKIPDPEKRYQQYPHEFSGGMRQRVMIAMALANEPSLLIADEPTTALDVTTQAQILELLKDLRKDLSTAIMMITHDLGVVADFCDDIIVMYAGKIVEKGDKFEIFYDPMHPYTWGLLDSIPKGEKTRLKAIPGMPPGLLTPPKGCAFADRCKYRMNVCSQEESVYMKKITNEREVHCWLYHPEASEALEKAQADRTGNPCITI